MNLDIKACVKTNIEKQITSLNLHSMEKKISTTKLVTLSPASLSIGTGLKHPWPPFKCMFSLTSILSPLLVVA